MAEDDCTPNVYAYNLLMRACNRDGQWERSLRTFDALVQELGPEGPDSITWNIVMSARIRTATAHPLRVAMTCLSDMAEAGFTPTEETWTQIMSTCAALGDVPRATLVLAEMRTRGFEIPVEIYTAALKVAPRSCWAPPE
ncbi:hypothetical protein CYMTET_32143, partial [Cymbomonas tetramitiformis]